MDARIVVPPHLARGEAFEVRIQIRHPMETGYRTDDAGRSIARNAIRTLACRYNGELVFASRLSPGIAANPYVRFLIVAADSGELAFEWVDDLGLAGNARIAVTVS
jgi:sulfur-oxidizing protein SoxZ